MHILFLTSRVPFPPDRGDRLRTYQFLRDFSREHQVTLVSFVGNAEEARQAEELAEFCSEIHLINLPAWRSILTVVKDWWRDLPLQVLFYQSAVMRKTLNRLAAAKNFDLAYVHLFRMAPYVTDLPGLYRIVDFTDMISLEVGASLAHLPLQWRSVYRIELPRLQRYERRLATQIDEAWFISARDARHFYAGPGAAKVQVVPNMIDPGLFEVDSGGVTSNRLLFVGHLEVKHNIDALHYFADQIFPAIRDQIPDCELHIVGAGNPEAVNHLSAEPGVLMVGFVPDLAQAYSQAAVSVAPLRFSSGIQNKVIEAMAAGVPVVCTSDVNDGVGAVAGKDLLVAHSSQEFVAQVVSLLRDDDFRRSVGQAGRRHAKRNFSSEAALARLKMLESSLPD
jgi:sugar transferase (PEP-CTERM/EpsH1 system associated)